MSNQDRPRIAALREAYAALNRNDVEGFLADFDPAAVRVEMLAPGKTETFRGIDEIRAHVIRGRGTWKEGPGCTPERFVVAGDKIVVSVHVRVVIKGETDWMDGRLADVYTWRDGRIVEFRSFYDEREAHSFAGA